MAKGKNLTVDVGGPIRRWWQRNAQEVTSAVSLAQAFSDVGVIALAHIAQRLTDDKTPMAIKDRMAERIAPRLALELKGRIPKGGEKGEQDGVGGILGAYQIEQRH